VKYMSNSAAFKGRLKRTRQNKNLTQKQLAEAVGLGARTIGRYEQGSSFPNERVLHELAEVLKVKTDWLSAKN